jgi:D-alanyl-D-alanine carboxypeptidase/Putative peptidoglycan binding domain
MPDVSDLSWRIPFGPIVGSIMARRPPARPGIVYGGHELRLSDNDAQKKWGGNVHAGAAAGGFVAELQDDLKKVGCYDARVDGGYGAGTRDAVKRFQWCLAKATHRYAAGASQLSAFVNDPMVIITGNADRTTARHLKTWVADGFEVTGTLRVVAFSRFGEFRRGAGFDRLANASVGANDMVVHKDFVAGLESINQAAANAGVRFQVNQTLRLAGRPVGGAVVTPATNSQHLIGNAVDFNILHDGKTINSQVKWDDLPQAAKDFITKVKAANLRWGGDFTKPDRIHFDAYLAPSGPDFKILYFLNQRTMQRRQPIPRAT